MDQATKLRELVNKKNTDNENSYDIISIVSGKGGVGKTTLATILYSECDNSFIVDSDINAPYFWLYEKKYNCCPGFESYNGKKLIKNIDINNNLSKYDYVFVDAGTGINEVNQYFFDKSKLTIFVSNMEEISILNTMNLMKKVISNKVIYLNNCDDDNLVIMQDRINKYAHKYLNNKFIKAFNDEDELVKYIKNKKY